VMLAASGRIEEALAQVHDAGRIARELDPPPGFVDLCVAQVHTAQGSINEALRHLSRAIEVLRDCGDLAYASTMLGWKAALLLEQGHDEEAERVIEEAAEVTSRYDVLSVGLVEACRAVLAARKGDHAEAAARASKALDAIDAGDQMIDQADIRRCLSEVPRRVGDAAAQRRLLTEARDLYRSKGHLPLLAATEELLQGVSD
jgi:ATP/maltotriose-dependent transcriptional regulator MalT